MDNGLGSETSNFSPNCNSAMCSQNASVSLKTRFLNQKQSVRILMGPKISKPAVEWCGVTVLFRGSAGDGLNGVRCFSGDGCGVRSVAVCSRGKRQSLSNFGL
jgi:hypothetical protein